MKKIIMVLGLMLALTATMALSAGATMITGAISFSGTAIFDDGDASVAFTDFSKEVVSDTGGTGDYAVVPSDTAATFNPFGYLAPVTVTPFQLWTLDYSGKTYSLNATSIVVGYNDGGDVVVKGTGIAYITGYDATPGTWSISANRAGGTASFSSSAKVSGVPEPGTLLLLGFGLIGLAGYSRSRIKK
jgi:hypothetical protein